MPLGRTRQNRTVENLKKLFREKIVGWKTVIDGEPTVHGPDPKVAVLLGLEVPEGKTLTEVAFPDAAHPQVSANPFCCVLILVSTYAGLHRSPVQFS